MKNKIPWNKGKHMWKDIPHPRGMNGKIPWNKGIHVWKNKKHPKGMLGKRGYTPWNKGLTKEKDSRIKQMTEKAGKTIKKLYKEGKLIHPMLGKKLSERVRKKISETEKRLYREGKIKPYWLGKKNPALSATNRKNWQKKEYREKVIKNTLKATRKRPTSLEKQMIKIIKNHDLPYKYVGDGSFLIGYKNPDFVNVNGQKICIEVANRYHHPDLWKENRIKHFTKYGWKCIVFFENTRKNLNEEEILKTL